MPQKGQWDLNNIKNLQSLFLARLYDPKKKGIHLLLSSSNDSSGRKSVSRKVLQLSVMLVSLYLLR